MLPEDKFFETNNKSKIWERYCGFLDLSLEEFMRVQHRLLMEQISLMSDTPIGKKIMNGKKPRNTDEFRKVIPLTTYKDYEPYLSEKQNDALIETPLFWSHSSGRGGYFKWIPYTHRGFETFAKRALATVILGSAKSKGEVHLKAGDRMLVLMPPRPYTSGSGLYYLNQRFSMRVIPPIEETEDIEFRERVTAGFGMALKLGVDVMFSIASVLVKMGETMSERAQKMRFSVAMLKPGILFRLLRALLTSKISRRPLLPKDLWKPKAILTSGADVSIYKDQIAYYWGQIPYEIYGGTEAFTMAMQGWNRKWLTFIPDVAFWEFIPEEEHRKSMNDPSHQPVTVLFNEVKAGKTYEVVLTHFHGMPLFRYRLYDLVTFVSLKDEETGVNLPQMIFKARVGETINLGGLTDLDEGTIWRALVNTGVKFEDWSARKEYHKDQTCLRLYLELKEEREAGIIEQMVDQRLKEIDLDYRDVGAMLELQPVRVTLLSTGTFQRYYEEKHKEGADLANLKPPHMNASDATIERLLKLS